MKELDSTQDLLDSTIEMVDSVVQDSSEDEVFFGKKSSKEETGQKKSRRDTIQFSGSSWKSFMEANRDKLSLSSSSTGRSSLLDAENSISEEFEDEVFEDSVEDVDPGSSGNISGEEMEFFQSQADNSSSQESLAVSSCQPAALEISGIQPLVATQSFQDQSVSGIYDSFSDATTEEMLEEGEDEEAERLTHVKRKILQDSTMMSSASFTADEDSKRQRLSPSSTPSIIVTSEETADSQLVFPASPESSVYVTAPSSRNTSRGGAETPQFDTTMEEMALYEMYGEEYDEVVAALSKPEKLELLKKLESRGEKEKEEIQLKFEQIDVASKLSSYLTSETNSSAAPGSIRDPITSIGSTISPFSLNSSVNTATPSPGNPEVFHLPPQDGGEPIVSAAVVTSLSPGPALPQFTNNFMLPTTASINKMKPHSPIPNPSPRKKSPWLPPSPSPSKALSKSPHSSARRHTPVSRLPQPVRKPALPALLEAGPGPRTPMSGKRVAGVKSAYAAVNSPVAAYVKNNPVPHLVQNVKAKEPETPLDSTMVEVEGKENNARLSLLPQCPLPSAVYQASSVVAGEEDTGEDQNAYEYVTEAYGAVSRSAKVTKHVSRVQLPKTGLTWTEDLLAYDESCNSSPSMAKFKPPGRPVLKTTRRDSGLFDESMMNVSVVETKVVKKVARGKGGARGKGKGKGKVRLIDRNPYH